MNILQAKNEIKTTIKAYLMKDAAGRYCIPVSAQRPVLLIGPPGIGKTAIMEQIADECGLGLVSYTMTHHTRQSAIGLPMIERKDFGGKEYSATEYTMSEIIGSIYDEMKASKKNEGILFLDEINCVSETLSPAMLALLQKKMFGSHHIPDGWIIVAAGNPPEYNKSVREFDIVTLDRVRKIDISVDFSVWKSYAYERGVHPAVMTYLEIKKENFYQIETTATGRRFATARGWEDLSYMIHALEACGLPLSADTVSQYIQHEKTARDFANYYDLYCRYKDDYHVREILEGKISPASIEKIRQARFDEKLSLIGLLIGSLNSDFKSWKEHNGLMETLYGYMKELKSLAAPEKMSEYVDSVLESLNSRTDVLLIYHLENYKKMLLLGKCFEDLKVDFNLKADELDRLCDEGLTHIEAAFDFIEEAFGESQEMVIFITELNTSRPAVDFIRENGCERYYKYNEGLLFSSGRNQMLKEIEDLRHYMDFTGI